MIWLIWSNEHRAFWGPGCHGYTTDTRKAGHYTETHARQIVHDATRWQREGPPNEVMLLAPSANQLDRDFPDED
jgi:hypothetical protein